MSHASALIPSAGPGAAAAAFAGRGIRGAGSYVGSGRRGCGVFGGNAPSLVLLRPAAAGLAPQCDFEALRLELEFLERGATVASSSFRISSMSS